MQGSRSQPRKVIRRRAEIKNLCSSYKGGYYLTHANTTLLLQSADRLNRPIVHLNVTCLALALESNLDCVQMRAS